MHPSYGSLYQVLISQLQWQSLVSRPGVFDSRSILVQVAGLKSHNYNRGPSAPYMTSTMLMDAANQLGSNVAATTTAAQGLFEGDVEGMLGEQGHSSPCCTVAISCEESWVPLSHSSIAQHSSAS